MMVAINEPDTKDKLVCIVGLTTRELMALNSGEMLIMEVAAKQSGPNVSVAIIAAKDKEALLNMTTNAITAAGMDFSLTDLGANREQGDNN